MLLLSALLSVGLVSACPDVCRCSARGRVYCNNKLLHEIPFGLPIDTQILFLQNNNLINSPELTDRLQQLPQLEKLMLYNNDLVHFPAFRSDTLRELNLNGNEISSIDGEAYFPKLDKLNLDDNNLVNEDRYLGTFESMVNLRVLSMDKNLLTAFPTGLPSSLETLILSNNKISTFSLASVKPLINLQVLRMDKNKINDQSFEDDTFGSLLSLQELDVSYNYLTHLPRGLQSQLVNIRLSSNQLVYLVKDDFRGLHSLRNLDIAYNRLRSIEDGALQSLTSLSSLDLSGNNWSCDCYLRSLKQYLSRTSVHHGQREELLCGEGGQHAGKAIDRLRESQFICEPVKFTVNPDLITSNSAVVQWSEEYYAPPYVTFKLNLSGVTDTGDIGVLKEIPVHAPLEGMVLSDLNSFGQYRICIYNAYFWEQTNFDESCEEFLTVRSISKSAAANAGDSNGGNLETLIGLMTGALVVILSLIIVAVLFWKSNRFSTGKMPDDYPRTTATFNSKYDGIARYYGDEFQNQQTYSTPYLPNSSTHPLHHVTLNQTQQTLDAASEFNVALVPSENLICQPNQPPSYVSQTYGTANNGVFV